MAMAPAVAATELSSTDPVPGEAADGGNAAGLRLFVFALFFIFGGITSLNDVIIPKLKELFTLSYAQAMLVQSAFFAAYFIMSLPGAAIVRRFGYLRSAAIGLVTMTAGCLLFVPASSAGVFALFLLALFVLASGITIVQVVANPLISLLGPPATAHSRLTFAQAFNSLGTTVFPLVGSGLILGSLKTVSALDFSGAALDAYRSAETHMVVITYLGIAAALMIVAVAVWTQRNSLQDRHASSSILGSLDLFRRPRFAMGAGGIFVYVGAEVAIGSLIVNYLQQTDVFGISQHAAGPYLFFYWFGALVGRFIGSAVLRFVSPGKLLATVAAVAIALLALSANSHGAVAGWALLSVGLFNSIMFPTIFSLASEGLGTRAADGSGLICVAIVGGAVIPPLTGTVADATSLGFALIVPAVCYAFILGYGIYARRPAT